MAYKGLFRLAYEYGNLARVLHPRDFLRVLGATLRHAPAILRTGRLTRLDQAMGQSSSPPLELNYRGTIVRVPIAEIDLLLRKVTLSFVFGTVREMIANDVYLRAFRPDLVCTYVLDLGSNRGVFSALASVALSAKLVLEVEPRQQYAVAAAVLARANGLEPSGVRRYCLLVGTVAMERARPDAFVSVERMMRENGVPHIDFAKIDIEGAEQAVFAEAGWLTHVQNLALELHPEVSDTRAVLQAIEGAGFDVRLTDQFGRVCALSRAMFLYASRDGSLLPLVQP